MKFVTELPQDVLTILKKEYPDKSYQAAIKAFVRKHYSTNGVKDDKAYNHKECSSAQNLHA